MLDRGTRYFTDSRDRQIICVPVESSRGDHFSVEVVDKGEVVDHFQLYGEVALTNTTLAQGWKEQS